jgi:hypothetical protein
VWRSFSFVLQSEDATEEWSDDKQNGVYYRRSGLVCTDFLEEHSENSENSKQDRRSRKMSGASRDARIATSATCNRRSDGDGLRRASRATVEGRNGERADTWYEAKKKLGNSVNTKKQRRRTSTGAAAAADIDGLDRGAIIASTGGASAAHLDKRRVAGPEAKHAGASQAEIFAHGVVNLQARGITGGSSSVGADGDTRIYGLHNTNPIKSQRLFVWKMRKQLSALIKKATWKI